jgi:F-type H+-transporting ATPase subunit a
MIEHVLAASGSIKVGEHPEVNFLGLTLNIDTVIGTLVASAVVLALGFFVRAKVTSGVPNGAQLFFETITKFLKEQIQSTIGVRTAPFLIPLSVGLFVFLLACNWLSILPAHEFLPPPTADVNLVYPLAILVFCWKHVAGARHRGGPGKQFIHVAKGHKASLAPMWILEEFTNMTSHALRLFGNVFAGGVMLSLFTLIPPFIAWAPNAGWKLFEMFIGLIQALIFALLTIIYFSQAMESHDEEHAH